LSTILGVKLARKNMEAVYEADTKDGSSKWQTTEVRGFFEKT